MAKLTGAGLDQDEPPRVSTAELTEPLLCHTDTYFGPSPRPPTAWRPQQWALLTRRHSAALLAPRQIGISPPSKSEAHFHVHPGRIAPLMGRAAICCFLLLWLFPLSTASKCAFKCRHCTLLKYAKRPEQGRRTERGLFSPEIQQDSGNRPRMGPNRTSSGRKMII